MWKFVSLLLILVTLGTAGIAVADPNLSDVPKHRHYVNGVQVGPRVCDDANLQDAFNQFHDNTHSHNFSGGTGPVAPGLHNGMGGEITITSC